MKNKIKLIVVLSLVTIVAALFSGCFLTNFNRVQSISLVGMPKTAYYVNDEFDAADAKVEITYKNANQEKTVVNITEENFDIDFSSANEGTFKCTIKYKSNGKVYDNISLSFDYSVILRGGVFTEGDGSKSSPYVAYTAEQFSHIGDVAGQYYVLGDNIDLTKVTPAGSNNGIDVYNTNTKSFNFDGQNFSITISGYAKAVFQGVKDSTISNLTLNIKPGSEINTLTLWSLGGKNVFENITINGSTIAMTNTGLICQWPYYADSLVLKNCTNNANITGNSPRFSAFLGLVNSNCKEITFDHCVNNGNLEGNSSFVFIANNAQQVSKINLINDCRNNGRLVGGTVGLFNVNGASEDETRLSKADYSAKLNNKLNEFSFECNTNDFVKLSKMVVSGSNDVSLVKNSEGFVVMNDEAKAKLGDGYRMEVLVREWIAEYDAEGNYLGTGYAVSKTETSADFAIPYARTEIDMTKKADSYEAISFEGGKLILAGMRGTNTFKLQNHSGASYQYYCYYIYDETGAMKYCGQIQYENIQNA